MPIIPKIDMSEEDIKLYYVTPALIQSGWADMITMETKVKFTDGEVDITGNVVRRKAPKRADYVLYGAANYPIAIVEAKDNTHGVSDGLQQAMDYAVKLDLPFAYSTNGDAFMEHDFLTGAEREIPLDSFPTPDELRARYEATRSDSQRKLALQPYCSGQNIYGPRYYQRIAINRTIDAIANGQDRILLVMATGTGKTYTAFQICYRLLRSGAKKKVLYLADRNFLVDTSIQQDFAPLEKTIHKIDFSREDPSTITSFEMYFSLYQQLSDRQGGEEEGEGEAEEEAVSKLAQLFKPDFFDLVIVDECHRGSAKKDSTWRKILEYFSSATQIGMTATPAETSSVSNIDYFGEPLYIYSLREGISDGYLAPFKVIDVKMDISDGWRPTKGQTDIFGNEIEDREYNNSDYDYNIVIESRIYQVANEITEYLKATDRMQKTIVFCATEAAAERMRVALVNLNQDMMRANPDYIVRITGSDPYGKSKLKYFLSASSEYPVIATTSKLLSTGADAKMVKLIALDQMIGSMTEFKQIIGRGTRLREQDGKMFFMIMDFRKVSRLFADPKWDGPIEQVDSFDPDAKTKKTVRVPPIKPREEIPFVDMRGCPVRVINRTVSVYDSEGKLLRYEDIINYTKTNVLGQFASLSNFIKEWDSAAKKAEIRDLLYERGIDLERVKADQGMSDVDDFDFICHVAFDAKPLTRKERAEGVRKSDFFGKYSGVAREVLEALLDKYMNTGIYELEKTDVLRLDPLNRYGAPKRIADIFGGREAYFAAVKALEAQIYRVGA